MKSATVSVMTDTHIRQLASLGGNRRSLLINGGADGTFRSGIGEQNTHFPVARSSLGGQSMPARAYWKGYLKLSLVTCPIGARPFHFHTVELNAPATAVAPARAPAESARAVWPVASAPE